MKITNTLKQKSKEFCSLLAYAIAASLITSPLAFAAPFQANQGTVNTKFRTTFNSANGCSFENMVRSCFYASSQDDFFTGESQSYIEIRSFYRDPGGYYRFTGYISCSFSGSAGIVSVNTPHGNTSIKATLNPSDPSCGTLNWQAGTVMVNLSGSYRDGDYRASSSGKAQQYYNGTTYKSNSQFDEFHETFTGSMTGFSGPWTGSAYASRNTNREQVK